MLLVFVQLVIRVSDSLQPHGLQHARLPSSSPTPWACSNSYRLSQWCHPTILSSVVPFSSGFPSFPASGSFPVSRLFSSSGQSIGGSASASVLPMNIQDWFSLGLTGLISLQSKGNPGLNQGPLDFQSNVLPTELFQLYVAGRTVRWPLLEIVRQFLIGLNL